MRNQATAITKDSFTITGRGIILELKHQQEGLAKGTELVSERTGLAWKVMVRILFGHAVQEQKIFEVESIDYMLMRFHSVEKKQHSIDQIKDREAQNIYQYLVQSVNHTTKPEHEERLIITPQHQTSDVLETPEV